MQYISGISREQVSLTSLDIYICSDHQVRFIDAFVDEIDLRKLGFKIKTLKKEGRPGYRSSLFMKLFLYGYLNGIRSGRDLEKECYRNVEVQWLLHGLTPNYHSICDFRKNNPKALRQLFKLFVSFLRSEELIAGELIAIDGTKVRANNSKKANYSQSKIDRHVAYIDNKVEEYLHQLEAADATGNGIEITNIASKLASLKERKLNYEILEQQLQSSGDTQISTTDPDARALLVQGVVVEISHNMQAAVDAKHKLVVATHTINRNDRNAMTDIALEARENMEVETFTSLFDKGYHNGRQIQQCKDAGITTIVAQQNVVNSNEKGTTPEYMVTKFVYNEEENAYTCPEGKTLTTTGTWHEKKTDGKVQYLFRKYRTTACKDCAVRQLCTAKADGRREIDRSEFATAVEENNQRYRDNPDLYRQRQEINEHIFGTIKRQWGYNHTNLRGLEKVNGEHSLIMLVYNIKRTINILGIPKLIERIKNWKSPYKRGGLLLIFTVYFKPKCHYFNFQSTLAA